MMRDKRVNKKYIIMVRGFVPELGRIDTPIKDDSGQERESLTLFRRLGTVELDIRTGKYQTSRYSLVEAIIETGRRHQIRRHFARISHPVIGDSTYGDIRHNHTILGLSGLRRLMLFSFFTSFVCPLSGKTIEIRAVPDEDILNFFSVLGWEERLAGLFPQSVIMA